MKTALVFDIDNTITPPRRPLMQEMAEILIGLETPFFIVAGSDLPLIKEQLLKPLSTFGFHKNLDAFLCNGATRYRCDFSNVLSIDLIRDFDFRNYLGEDNFKFMITIVEQSLKMKDFILPPPMVVLGEQIVFRHSMVNVAPIGRPVGHLTAEAYRNRDSFVEYDKKTNYRRRMLTHFENALDRLYKEKKLSISLGGETSFDFVIEGNDKSYAIDTLLKEGFKKLIYIGDALFIGGNDEAILRYINRWTTETHCPVQAIQVNNWKETMRYLDEMGFLKRI